MDRNSPGLPAASERVSFIDRISSGFEKLTNRGRRAKELGAAALRLFTGRGSDNESSVGSSWEAGERSKELAEKKEAKKSKKKNRVASAIAGLFRRNRSPESSKDRAKENISIPESSSGVEASQIDKFHSISEASVISRLVTKRRESMAGRIAERKIQNHNKENSKKPNINKEVRELGAETVQVAPLPAETTPKPLPTKSVETDTAIGLAASDNISLKQPVAPERYSVASNPEQSASEPEPTETFQLPATKKDTLPMTQQSPILERITETAPVIERPYTTNVPEYQSEGASYPSEAIKPDIEAATEGSTVESRTELDQDQDQDQDQDSEARQVTETPKTKAELAEERFAELAEKLEGERLMHNPEYLKQQLDEQTYGENTDNIQLLLERLRNGESDSETDGIKSATKPTGIFQRYWEENRNKILLKIVIVVLLATAIFTISIVFLSL